MHATERLTVDQALIALENDAAHARTLFARLKKIVPFARDAVVADIGAAQGLFLIHCARLGYRAVGVEPWDEARVTAHGVAERLGMSVALVDGTAESVPLPSESFDLVHAKSVIEHVADARQAFAEAHRLLRPGGVFWFYTASSLCPRQNEITGFPAFGWYPDPLKQQIMRWAVRARPELVGHTDRPAIHWFTPWKARRMLRAAGFCRIYDRWDLHEPAEEAGLRSTLVTLVRKVPFARILADMFKPGCAYAAVK